MQIDSNKSKIPEKIVLAMGLTHYTSLYQTFYLVLKSLCKRIIIFNSSKNALLYGQNDMNEQIVKLAKKEKPEYIFFYFTYDEIYLETLVRIKQVSPLSKLVNFFPDDDTQFDDFSRYCALFFDYNMICQKNYLSVYKKEGIKNVFFIPSPANIENFKPLNLEKKHDLTFIGVCKGNRPSIIKYLIDKGINVRLYGSGWGKYPLFSHIYYGIPDNEEIVRIINQSKINLSFSENKNKALHYKGRIFEISACKSFGIDQNFKGYLNFFKENKEIVMFKNKEDLLKKIRYYLEHKDKREKIAERAYNLMIKKYSINIQLKKFIEKTNKEIPKKINLPKIDKKSVILSDEDLMIDSDSLKERVRDYDYVHFKIKNCTHLPFKEYLQIYSLEKTGKCMSCCSYYVRSRQVPKYLFWFFDMNQNLRNDEFNSFLDLNQLMVRKDFFIKNVEKFRQAPNKSINFVNKDNTIFISLPLVEISKPKSNDYQVLKKVFRMKFLHNLYSLYHQKKIFKSSYSFFLFFEILKGNTFIINALIETLKDKGRKTNAEKLMEI